MKFLLDVHVSTRIARVLDEAGHDVLRAALSHPTAEDRELLAIAVRDSRVIVTQDSDFSDLIFAWGCTAPRSLIFVRCPPRDQPMMAERLLATLDSSRLNGHIVVLTATTTRYRAFPKAAND